VTHTHRTRVRAPNLSGRGSRTGHRPGGACSGSAFAGAAVPVPVSGKRPTRVLADGTQYRFGLDAASIPRKSRAPHHFAFMICACLRAGAIASSSLSSVLFEFIPFENAERRTSEAKKLRPSVGTMMICSLSESRSAMIF
jgi:hypothetical protein